MLAIFGGVVGTWVGYEGCRFLWSFRPPDVARNLADPKLDSTVFVFAFLLSIMTAFIFGVMPSLRASKTDLVDSLKEESHLAAPSAGSARLQKFFSAVRLRFRWYPWLRLLSFSAPFNMPTQSIPASTRITSLSS